MNLATSTLLKEEPFVFFVGSGVSSAPPTLLDTGARAIRTLCRSIAPNETIESRLLALGPSALRFEVLIHYLDQWLEFSVPGYFGTRIIPNANHSFLAAALKRGIGVLTTNFDCCIESGCDMLDFVPPVLIYPNDFDKATVEVASLAKLHGCVSDPETIQATTYAIASVGAGWRDDGPKTRFLERIARGYYLVVMGYSGSDDFDINPTFANCPVRGLVWVDHRPGEIVEASLGGAEAIERAFGSSPPSLLAVMAASRPETPIHIVKGDTGEIRDRLAGDLGWELGLDVSDDDVRQFTLEDYLQVADFDRPSLEGSKRIVAAMIFRSVGDHQAVRDVLAASEEVFQGTTRAYRELLLGRTGIHAGELAVAQAHLEAAATFARRDGSPAIAGETQLELGRLAALGGQTDLAETLLIRATAEMGALGAGSSNASAAMLEVGRLYYRLGRMEDAADVIGGALQAAAEYGHLAIESQANELLRDMGYEIGQSSAETRRILKLMGSG